MTDARKVDRNVDAILYLFTCLGACLGALWLVCTVGKTSRELRDRIEIVNEVQRELVEKMELLNKRLIVIPCDGIDEGCVPTMTEIRLLYNTATKETGK